MSNVIELSKAKFDKAIMVTANTRLGLWLWDWVLGYGGPTSSKSELHQHIKFEKILETHIETTHRKKYYRKY